MLLLLEKKGFKTKVEPRTCKSKRSLNYIFKKAVSLSVVSVLLRKDSVYIIITYFKFENRTLHSKCDSEQSSVGIYTLSKIRYYCSNYRLLVSFKYLYTI